MDTGRERGGVAELARRCNVSRQTADQWIRDGKIVRDGDSWVMAEGYALQARTSLAAGRGKGGEPVCGRCERTMWAWRKAGLVDAEGRTAPGVGVRVSYHPVRIAGKKEGADGNE